MNNKISWSHLLSSLTVHCSYRLKFFVVIVRGGPALFTTKLMMTYAGFTRNFYATLQEMGGNVVIVRSFYIWDCCGSLYFRFYGNPTSVWARVQYCQDATTCLETVPLYPIR